MSDKTCAPGELRESVPPAEGKFPMEIGEMFEGQRIRRPEMYAEFGGVDVPKKFELVLVKGMEEVEDGKIEVIGPDLPELTV